MLCLFCYFFFFQAEDGIRDVAVTGVQTCALPILPRSARGFSRCRGPCCANRVETWAWHCSSGSWAACSRYSARSRSASSAPCYLTRSEEHTSELQSRLHLVCRLLLEKKNSRSRSTDRRP